MILLLRQEKFKIYTQRKQIAFRILMYSHVLEFADWKLKYSKPKGLEAFSESIFFFLRAFAKTAKSEF